MPARRFSDFAASDRASSRASPDPDSAVQTKPSSSSRVFVVQFLAWHSHMITVLIVVRKGR